MNTLHIVGSSGFIHAEESHVTVLWVIGTNIYNIFNPVSKGQISPATDASEQQAKYRYIEQRGVVE